MASPKYKVTWKTFLLPAIGIIAFLAYLYLFNVDIPTIIRTVQERIDPSIYSWAIIFLILQTLFFSLSWRSLINFLSVKLSVVKSFLYVWYGIFMDIIIPAESISGELSRIYLVTREQNKASGKVVASLVAHRLIGMTVNVISLLVGTSLLVIRGQLTGIVLNLTLFLTSVITAFMVLLILLCVKEKWTLKIVDALIRFAKYVSRGRWKLTKIREETVEAAKTFHASMKEFGHGQKTLSASSLLYVLAWFLSLGIDYLVFCSIGFPVPLTVIIVTYSIVIAVKSIPIGVPFEVGLPEITMTTLYMALIPWPPEMPLDMRAAICGTATILNRLLTLWLRFFIGFAAQQWLEIKAIKTAGAVNKMNKNLNSASTSHLKDASDVINNRGCLNPTFG